MSRHHIAGLISAVQERVRPHDRIPTEGVTIPDSASESFDVRLDERTSFVVPPDSQRAMPPDWVLMSALGDRDSSTVIPLEVDDEVTIEADQEGDVLQLPSEAERSTRNPGTPAFEALAYYLPFHFYRSCWGIYIKASGVLQLTQSIVARTDVARNFLQKDEKWIVSYAYKCLLLHEYFHHMAEIACSRLEYAIATATNWGTDHYSKFFTDPVAGYVEEAVANAYLVRSIDQHYSIKITPNIDPVIYRHVRHCLLVAMEYQPDPYNKFRLFLDNDRYGRGRDLLIDRMCSPWGVALRLSHRPMPGTVLGAGMYFAGINFATTQCPTYLVVDTQSVRIGRPFPKTMGLEVFVYANDHLPPHIHVQDLNKARGHTVRYLWPSLNSYSPEERLPSQLEKHLKAYAQQYGPQISARIHATYGAAAAQ